MNVIHSFLTGSTKCICKESRRITFQIGVEYTPIKMGVSVTSACITADDNMPTDRLNEICPHYDRSM